MVRYLVMFERPEDPEAFDRHYREVHVPLAKGMPGLRRFAVSRSPAAIRGESYYLVAALDWDDMSALERAFRSPAGRATAKDVPNLADHGRVRSMTFELEDI
ncbi:EthD family reductase [Nocardia terpenica]|nr:EthD family reductase [Nocardia terpenica]MBF6105670.1 EthD family reductase [Nocardia terpenica]MBF6112860.1 EthD family reductase [Nocardia terpenica]MBF6118990.1 EthD family reductase [Nocardia terpenica]